MPHDLKIDPRKLAEAVDAFIGQLDPAMKARMRAQIPELGVELRPMAADPTTFMVLLAITEEPLFTIWREHLEDPSGISEGWVR
ncbi:MAG TPA: hypothetical protein PK020_05400 [Ilumatobacteraceae bacterium]|nr:hypothetical protein [Ilumatobacteraceae bacterium]